MGKLLKNGNSAIRYVDENGSNQVNCLALIVSEDGYVDLYSTSMVIEKILS